MHDQHFGPAPLRTNSPRYPASINVEREKSQGWRDHGILVVSVTDPRLTWDDRELVAQLGRKLYGTRSVREPVTME